MHPNPENHPVACPVRAGLSTSGKRGLRLPHDPGRLTIASDQDSAGHAAAKALAEHVQALGWPVALLAAPDGQDWHDLLTLNGEFP
jgi:DNA primase